MHCSKVNTYYHFEVTSYNVGNMHSYIKLLAVSYNAHTCKHNIHLISGLAGVGICHPFTLLV